MVSTAKSYSKQLYFRKGNRKVLYNDVAGEMPGELGNLTRLESLDLANNALTDRLPRSFMQLINLRQLRFGGQALYAPEDDTFQAWLNSIPYVDGPTC